MDRVRSHHAVAPRRLVALALIAAVAIGLGYLHSAPASARLTVPPGARAGDLALQPCTYTTESGGYAAECGILVVAENRANPALRLIALPVTRIKATSSSRAEPIFYLEGGPGLSNMTFPQASRFAHDHDVVLVGYRGIDGSVRLDCPEVTSALKYATDVLGEQSFRAYGDAYRACAERLTQEGVDLANYGLPQQVDDLEVARFALGYDRIDLLSQSAGTRTGLIYAWRYPERIHRSVMLGANPPGHFLYDAQATDEQIRRYAELCAKDADCHARTDDLAASMRRTAADMPARWLFLPIDASNVQVFTTFALPESTANTAPLAAPTALDAWLSAAEGDASGFWLASLFGDYFPLPFVWGQYAAAGRVDAEAAHAYFSAGGQEHTNLAWIGSAFAWGSGAMVDGWPMVTDEDAYHQMRTSNVETLLISGALDTATPPQVATKEVLPYLPKGYQVVLPGFGHIASFFAEQPDAGTWLINTFLASGQVDDARYTPQAVDFAPATTLTAMAKVVAGTMVGLALLAVLSLLWMARCVHQRGRFGPKTSATLRSLCPIVLGLGGWFFGGLIVISTTPGVRLDDQLLVVLAAGVPIGLGIYFTWVHRDWSATTKIAGGTAAAGGALISAWLGFHATAGLLAPITAIVGAAMGANLTLLARDIWWDWQVRDQLVDTNAKATLEVLTSPIDH